MYIGQEKKNNSCSSNSMPPASKHKCRAFPTTKPIRHRSQRKKKTAQRLVYMCTEWYPDASAKANTRCGRRLPDGAVLESIFRLPTTKSTVGRTERVERAGCRLG